MRTLAEYQRMKEAGEHESELAYTTNDDGVHLSCLVCGTSVALGFWPTLELANEQWAAHLRGDW